MANRRCDDVVLVTTLALTCLSVSCHFQPSIEFTQVPEAGPGGPARTEKIAGHAHGNRGGQQIVIYARSGTWWVQPASNRPFTGIARDSSWQSTIHLGTEYAALLVDAQYVPPRRTDTLPTRGGGVLAIARIPGRPSTRSPEPQAAPSLPPKTIHFSGYDWDVVQEPTDSGGIAHRNSAANVWADPQGQLHLRIGREGEDWTCAEISLSRNLGYGRYSFVLKSLPRLEPGTVLGMFTWDPEDSEQNHREINIELSQWGDPASKNTQFVVQPYYVPANVFRFDSIPGPGVHSFQWEPDRVVFQSVERNSKGRIVAEHVFSSGVPSPGGERVHINLYVFGKTRIPQRNPVEVVVERFEYLP